MKIVFSHTYHYIISLENLLLAWKEFVKGKRKRKDVQEFEFNLMDNIISLHNDLSLKTYRHSSYQAFNISDPKPRIIHKASIRDRLLHRAVYRVLYPFFDKTFISDSFSCRVNKGTHKAINRFRSFIFKVSKNNTKACWILKCDIKKFFASIDQDVLIGIINDSILDKDIIWLISGIIFSFYSTEKGKGLPLGNLTSQLFSNIYLNKFDYFVKHKLKAKYYIRYADDFVILSDNKKWLQDIVFDIHNFLQNILKLQMHGDKVFVKSIASGVDFLGWIHFLDHRVLRNSTRKRIFRVIGEEKRVKTIQSYLGLIKHGNARKIKEKIREICPCFS